MTRGRWIADCETTSLDANFRYGSGVIWELALLDPDTGESHLWRMKPELEKADPGALTVGRFYERTKDMCNDCRPNGRAYDLTAPAMRMHPDPEWSDPVAVAAVIAPMLSGATLICAVPTFDCHYLSKFLAHYGQSRQPWHYRARDIGSIAYGYLSGMGVQAPPFDAGTDDFAKALGVDPDTFERHSARGDCQLVAGMLRVIEGEPT